MAELGQGIRGTGRARSSDPRVWLALVLLLYGAVAVTFSLNMPLLEGSDEHAHFEYVLSLVRGQGLPIQQVARGVRNYEAHQPPLYYLASALATWWVDNTDYNHLMVVNPYSDYDPLALSNKNLYLHGQREAFPFRGAVLAMHLARLVSVAVGAGAVAATFALARTLLPGHAPLWVGAAAFVAFVPQFGSTSATINNDSLSVLTVALVLGQAARMAMGSAAPSTRQFAALGALFGLALLSKETGLLLAPFSAVVLCAVAAWRGWGLRRLVSGGAVAGIAAVALTGWWYAIRQGALGFWFGSPDTRVALGEMFRWERLAAQWTESEISFWGLFGWNIVPLPQPVYDALRWLALIGLAGYVVWLLGWKQRPANERLASAMLWLWVALMAAAYAMWVSASAQAHGRLFFPALPALAIVLCLGWTQWAPRAWRPKILLAVGALLFAIAAWSATSLMDEAYPSPRFVSAIDREMDRLNINLGNQITVAGYRAEIRSTPTGLLAMVDVVWGAVSQPKTDYTISLQIFDEHGKRIGHLDTYPVSGMYLTKEWMPGTMFQERYLLPLAASGGERRTAKVTVGLYERDSGRALRVHHPDGRTTARVELGTLSFSGQ